MSGRGQRLQYGPARQAVRLPGTWPHPYGGQPHSVARCIPGPKYGCCCQHSWLLLPALLIAVAVTTAFCFAVATTFALPLPPHVQMIVDEDYLELRITCGNRECNFAACKACDVLWHEGMTCEVRMIGCSDRGWISRRVVVLFGDGLSRAWLWGLPLVHRSTNDSAR